MILFACKSNPKFQAKTGSKKKSGLSNGVEIGAMDLGAKVCDVNDYNDLHFNMKYLKPDIVMIEAVWMPASHIKKLQGLYPNTKFFVRIHSEIPFLNTESNAMSFICEYKKAGIPIVCNSEDASEAFRKTGFKSCYLPNLYNLETREPVEKDDGTLDIVCPGSIRPMKSHLQQAMLAIAFAKRKRKKLRFHINASRIESFGKGSLTNCERLFFDFKHCELIRMPWLSPEEFREYLTTMDMGLQVSMTETFNIVAADMVTMGLPLVVSDQITWASEKSQVRHNDFRGALDAMSMAYQNTELVKENQRLLGLFHKRSLELWRMFEEAQTGTDTGKDL